MLGALGPAYHALDFAIATADSTPALEPFWQLRIAAHVFNAAHTGGPTSAFVGELLTAPGPLVPARRGGGGKSFAPQLAVSAAQLSDIGIVDATFPVSGDLETGTTGTASTAGVLQWPPAGAATGISLNILRAIRLWLLTQLEEQGEVVSLPFVPRAPEDSAQVGKVKCCVTGFKYPIATSVKARQGFNFIGFEFQFEGKYSDVPPCECDCCFFRQYVMYRFEKYYLIVGIDTGQSGLTEDCVVRNEEGEVVGATAAGDRPDEAGEWLDCYGPYWDQTEVSSVMSGECHWWDQDAPEMGLPPLAIASGQASYTFLGVVYDTCDHWRIAAIDAFDAEVAGFTWPGPMNGRWRRHPLGVWSMMKTARS